ncbi:MAG: microcin C ABC transporter permease YejB [Bdellovibrionales bacterium]
MAAYIIRRLLLIIPTLLGIMLLNFLLVQLAPGGPVEQMIAKLQGLDTAATARIGGGGNEAAGAATNMEMTTEAAATASRYKGAQGLDPEFIAELEKMYGFDKPPAERFFLMLKNYATLDFGTSYFRDTPVVDLVLEKLPVSISLGLWTTLLVYLVSIPLGIRKATRDGSAFDVWTSTVIVIGYAIPAFMFAIALIIVFAGGRFFDWFPLRGLTSDNFADLAWWQQVGDYLWHITLPVLAMVIGGFASLTFLTKNSFIEEINKQYVLTARAKGLPERKVLYGHVFRNAMLIVIAGLPAAFIGILFTSSLLIEVVFSLDGLGLLSFEAAIGRDYPVLFGTLFIFTLIGLLVNLIGDIIYMLVDPRINFNAGQQ